MTDATIGRRAVLAGAAALVATPAVVRAQAWPSKNLTLIVPFTPGGSTDILARALGQKLSEALGRQVVVENRPGAGGSIGADLVAKAAPDGHTLLLGHIGTLAVNPGIYPNLPYHPLRSFAPISLVADVHNVMVVNPAIPARDVKELIALAKAAPGTMHYGTGGNGSAAHIATAAFADAAGLDLVHVPYRGTAPAVTDLLGGRIQMVFTGGPAVLPQVQNGQLRALAVSGTRRIAAAPDLPTVAEAALPGFEASQWYGVLAPAGTPQAVLDRLEAETRKGMTSPDVVERLRGEGADVRVSTQAEFQAHIAAEIDRWGALIRRANIKAD